MAEINLLHQYPRIKRDLNARRQAQSRERSVAMRFGREFFDGDRSQGYGGYRYDGRWVPVAETFRDHWGLKAGDRVLDVGCAKGFLLRDLVQACPGIEVHGIDISEYAVQNADPAVRHCLQVDNAKKLPFPDGFFTAVISINTVHDLPEDECLTAIREIQRVSLGRAYIQVDSYRTPEEKAVFESWILTCVTHFTPEGWKEFFSRAGYTGDYYWTIAE